MIWFMLRRVGIVTLFFAVMAAAGFWFCKRFLGVELQRAQISRILNPYPVGATLDAMGFWVTHDGSNGRGIHKLKVTGNDELAYSDFDGDGKMDHKYTMHWSGGGEGSWSREFIRVGVSWVEVDQMKCSPGKDGRRTRGGQRYIFQGSEWLRRSFESKDDTYKEWSPPAESFQCRVHVWKRQPSADDTPELLCSLRNCGEKEFLVERHEELEMDGVWHCLPGSAEPKTSVLQPGREDNDFSITLGEGWWKRKDGDHRKFQWAPGKHTFRVAFTTKPDASHQSEKPIRVLSNSVMIELKIGTKE